MKKIVSTLLVSTALCATAEVIQLPAPVREGGVPLLKALNDRKSSREFADREIPLATLSSLLWAADGINRPDGRRTAPTGLNVQDIDVYAIVKSGAYRYDPKANALVLVNPGDHRAAAGRQDFAQKAPLNLFFVQDTSRAMKAGELDSMRYGGLHAGAVMQNVCLFCAANGLATVPRAYIDYDALSKALKLGPTQRTMLGQTVGYPRP